MFWLRDEGVSVSWNVSLGWAPVPSRHEPTLPLVARPLTLYGIPTPPSLHLFSLVPRPLFTPSAIHPFLSPWLCAIRQGLPCVKPPHACGGGCLDLEGLAYFEICKTGGSYLERPLLITGSATKGLPLPQHALV